MKRKIMMGFCVLAMLCGAAGCAWYQEEEAVLPVRGEAPDYDENLLTIGMIQTGKESDWRDANTQNYLDTFTKERGYNLIYIDGNSSHERQIKAMYDLIEQKVDYIIVQPIVENGWEEAMVTARRAGIPVIVADRQMSVSEQYYVSWIGSDFHKEGQKAITWLEEYVKEQGREGEELNIILLEGTEGATAAIGRTEGILEGMEKHPEWTIVAQKCANFTQGEGQTVVEDLLENELAGKRIDVIISENDNMIFGAMKALDRKGISYGPNGDIIMISFDALGEAFEKMMEGKLHVSVECNPLLAGKVEDVIMKVENGENIDKKSYTEEAVYTYENAAEHIAERTY